MNRLTKLPDIANECLGGLRADDALYARIRQGRMAPVRRGAPLRALALACSLVFALGLGAAVLKGLQGGAQEVPPLLTQAAGVLPGQGQLRALDVPRGSITLSTSSETPRYVGVWEKASGGSFPLIRAEDKYYRLLTNPTGIDSSMLGRSLGEVVTFTGEPALDQGGGILSNIVPLGAKVAVINGMEGTAVAAKVEGALRVFQRVSYSGNALVDDEGLEATLSGKVRGLQLSGVGTVADPEKAQDLMDILFSTASYQSAASRATDQALLIQYSNGIVLQMAVSDRTLIACGTWGGSAFLDAFRAAVDQ
ncbi:MAG: hypothetical protein AB9880_01045 [Christensenellales bacterium]